MVEGLSIFYFDHNAFVVGNASAAISADNNVIKGNYVGVSSSGLTAPGNGWDGVFIGTNAENNTIGGDEAAERNIISGNNFGVEIAALSASYEAANNVISGNYIGTDHTGTASLPNTQDGIRIYFGAQNNTVGGDSAIERNVISSNGRSGVRISGLGTDLNTVSANYIGVDKNGAGALGNISEGVFVGLGAQQNLVGGDTVGEQNVISGNLDLGVILTGTNTISNTVSGNKIGLNYLGIGSQGNSGSGVYLYNASHNIIGGDVEGERNYISGNYDGVAIFGPNAHENLVIGNYIGTSSTGGVAHPNDYAGVVLASEAHDNQIGGGSGDRNVISGNGFYGVAMDGSVIGNTVLGNYIGTDSTGEISLANEIAGVALLGSYGNMIGGETVLEWNVISGNNGPGVLITNGAENTVAGNIIGLSADMNGTLPNDSSGVTLSSSAHDNVIGGAFTAYPRNYICGNNGEGVKLDGAGVTQNTISGNVIGLYEMVNSGVGSTFKNGAHHNTIGGEASDANIITYNNQYGVLVSGDATDDNIISNNLIQYNNFHGISISEADDNRIGPKNTIKFNGWDGIWITGSGTTGNIITENGIGRNTDQGIDLDDGANGGILPPQIVTQEAMTVTGTACAGCTVELFESGDTEGEGWYYLNKTMADAEGDFAFTVYFTSYPVLTATATDATDGTSEFSGVFWQDRAYLFMPIIVK